MFSQTDILAIFLRSILDLDSVTALASLLRLNIGIGIKIRALNAPNITAFRRLENYIWVNHIVIYYILLCGCVFCFFIFVFCV